MISHLILINGTSNLYELYKSIYKCKSKISKLKANFTSMDKVVGKSSKRIFDFNSPNVICQITCNGYSFHYVGKTVQNLNERFDWHSTGFN